MPSLRDLYLLDARLSYVEQILATLGLINPVDPAPPDVSRLGSLQAEALRRPGGPIVDPAASDRVRLAEALLHRPPHGDPAASDRVRLAESLLRRPPHGDPPASDRVRLATGDVDPIVAAWIARLLAGVDPPPEDMARLTKTEIEATARAVSADMVRLKSIEGLLNERLKELDSKPAGAQ
jgi:hypothetical protein